MMAAGEACAARSLALKLAALLCVALFLVSVPAHATIRYQVSLANPSAHIFHVRMNIPNVQGAVTVQMAAWNTLYQVRDFAYHVTELHATSDKSGARLHVVQLDKQTWRVEVGSESGGVEVEYAAEWNEPGPFGSQINGEHAFLNPAMVLCYVPERRGEDTQLDFADVPQGWHIAVELPKSKAAIESEYVAADYDALADAPVEIGRFEEIDFQAAGRPIRMIVHGDAGDHGRLTQQISQIVEYETRMMGGPPFQEYMFLYHIGRDYGGGGMEHSNCTAISVPSVSAILNVSAHEFFHLWNVKRIRPKSLEPVDYTKEMYTTSLWFAEGLTNTYASYTLIRTGLWNQSQFLQDLGEQINELESRPARRWQSVEDSSLDAWFEKYANYELPQNSISYYNKGQLLGVGLDILIRDLTDNRASLDDVMRTMNQEYAQRGRFYDDSDGVERAVEEVLSEAGAGKKKSEVAAFFSRYVAGTDELPFADWLNKAGLVLETRGQRHATFGFTVSRNAAGAAVVSDLDIYSAAAVAGLREGDMLVTVDGNDVQRNMDRWLRGHRPGDMVRVHYRRGDSEGDVAFALGEEAAHDYMVEETSNTNERQRAIWNGMMQGVTSGHAR